MPQYDLAYDLSTFNWRNITGGDNDYRLVKNGNALSWKRKDDLVVGDLVIDSYDTDTSAIYHRAITVTYLTQATWNGATSQNGSATSMLAEYVGNGTTNTSNSVCANPTPASGSIPIHTGTSGQQIAGTWRLRFTPTTGTELLTPAGNLYLSFAFSDFIECFQIGTSPTDHSVMISTFGSNGITTAGTWTLERLSTSPIGQSLWNVGMNKVSGNGEWEDFELVAQDFDTLSFAGNGNPRGLWSDGTTVWVSDVTDPQNICIQLYNEIKRRYKRFQHTQRRR